MKTFTWLENIDRRVLGAVRFVSDVDGAPVGGPLEVSAAPGHDSDPNAVLHLRVLRNRFGLHVLQTAPGFEDYTNTFTPPPTSPDPESLVAHLRVADPSGQFLPAAFAVPLPRRLAGAASTRVSTPVEIRLLPAPGAALADGWAVLRVLVWREYAAGRFTPLRGALLRVLRPVEGGAPVEIGRGLTEWRAGPDGSRPAAAEALVAVSGISVTQWNTVAGGPVVSAGQRVRLELRYDPAFFPADAGSLPNFTALASAVPGAGIVSALLPDPPPPPPPAPAPSAVVLQARERRTLPLVLTLGGALQISQPT